jgi:hypothetical protein
MDLQRYVIQRLYAGEAFGNLLHTEQGGLLVLHPRLCCRLNVLSGGLRGVRNGVTAHR